MLNQSEKFLYHFFLILFQSILILILGWKRGDQITIENQAVWPIICCKSLWNSISFLQADNFLLWHTIRAFAVEVICIDLLSKCARRETASVILNIRLARSSLQYRIFCWELGIHQSSGGSWHHKATQGCEFNSYWFIAIYSWSRHQGAVPKHPLIVILYYYNFLNLQKRTRAGFTKSLHLCNYHII